MLQFGPKYVRLSTTRFELIYLVMHTKVCTPRPQAYAGLVLRCLGVWAKGYGVWAKGYGVWAKGYGVWAMRCDLLTLSKKFFIVLSQNFCNRL